MVVGGQRWGCEGADVRVVRRCELDDGVNVYVWVSGGGMWGGVFGFGGEVCEYRGGW